MAAPAFGVPELPDDYKLQSGDAAQASLPGDSAVRFWPHETGALMGSSETFVDVGKDGSYYDPSIGRRVAEPSIYTPRALEALSARAEAMARYYEEVFGLAPIQRVSAAIAGNGMGNDCTSKGAGAATGVGAADTAMKEHGARRSMMSGAARLPRVQT